MPLDRDAQGVLDMIRAAGRPPLETLSPLAAREVMKQSTKIFAPDPPQVAAARDLAIAAAGRSIPARLYRAAGTAAPEKLPVLLYFHGGGWLFGDLDTHDSLCRALANGTRAAVLAIDYRLAPEHKFPAAADDAVAAADWLAENAASLNLDRDRMAVGGDSAGGNLATVVALAKRGAIRFALQVLVYPSVDLGFEYARRSPNADDFLLTMASMRWFRGHYLNHESEIADWRASPMRAVDLKGMPPALVITAGYDPLHDEGAAYAERLKEAGVGVRYRDFPGQMHGFLGQGKLVPTAGVAIGEIAEALSRAFAA